MNAVAWRTLLLAASSLGVVASAGEPDEKPKYDPAEFSRIQGPPCGALEGTSNVRSRTDPALYERYQAYLRHPDARAGVAVILNFCGDLGSIMALGVEINGFISEPPGTVGVIVKYRDLQRLVEHPGVRRLSAGAKPKEK